VWVLKPHKGVGVLLEYNQEGGIFSGLGSGRKGYRIEATILNVRVMGWGCVDGKGVRLVES